METDAADGNLLTTRIPTAAWKAQNAFHSSHKARRRFHHRIHFFERQRSTLNTLSFGPKDGEHFHPGSERSEIRVAVSGRAANQIFLSKYCRTILPANLASHHLR